jgi:hypothetical protein
MLRRHIQKKALLASRLVDHGRVNVTWLTTFKDVNPGAVMREDRAIKELG